MTIPTVASQREELQWARGFVRGFLVGQIGTMLVIFIGVGGRFW